MYRMTIKINDEMHSIMTGLTAEQVDEQRAIARTTATVGDTVDVEVEAL